MKLLVGINKITIDEKSKLNAGEYNVHEVEFEFDEVYNGLITKAVFEGNGHSYLINIVNNKCTIPYEVLSEKGDITIGAYGYNIDGNNLVLRYSPSPIYTYVDLGSYRDSYDNYQQPTADIIEQLTNRIETAESQINEALEEVEGYNDRITTNTNNIDDLDNNKVDKIEGKGLSSNDYTNEEKTKLEGIETNAEVNIIEDIKVNDTSQSINNKSVNINIPTKTSDITNDSGFIDNSVNNLMNYTKSSDLATVATSGSYNDLSNKPTIPDVSSFITKDVNNLTNYTLKTNTGSLIDLEINNTTYVVTLSLKDIDGNVISTDTVDLPLENVVVSGRYDNNTKKVILTLENGSEVDFSVADLVAGLQTEITSTNKLASDLVDDSNSGNKFTNTSEKATWNAKYDKPISGIPKSDLTNDVQSSLNLADSALQSFTETDPIFSNSASAGITSNDISKWNNKQDTLIAGTNITIDNDGKTISATDTTYNDATTSASGLMSASDKTKLNGIETEANKTIVDDDFSDSSTNPLQNKVITDFIGTNATVTGTGTEFNLSNCLNKKLKDFKGYGDTKQDSLSGKNLLNKLLVNDNQKNANISTQLETGLKVTCKQAGTSRWSLIPIQNVTELLGETLTISANHIVRSANNEAQIGIWYISNNSPVSELASQDTTGSSLSLTFNLPSTLPVNATGIAVFVYSSKTVNASVGDYVEYNDLQLEVGSTVTSYEPYCGGIPSPNPSYPQNIDVVTGYNEVKFSNKNLFDKNNFNVLNAYFNPSTVTITYNDTNRTLYIPCKSNTNYTIQIINGAGAFNFGYTHTIPSTGVQVYGITDAKTLTTDNSATYLVCRFFHTVNATVTYQQILNSIQIEESSTPTEYVERQSQTYEINLGKNLLNINTSYSQTRNGITCTTSVDGTVTLNGTASGNVDFENLWEPLTSKANKSYSLNYIYVSGTINGSANIYNQDNNNSWQGWDINDIANANKSTIHTYTKNYDMSSTRSIRVMNGAILDNLKFKLQFVQSANADYNYSLYFTPIELCKIGTYKDYIYKTNNKWYLHKEIGKVVLDGSEEYAFGNPGVSGINAANLTIDNMKIGNYLNGLSSHFNNPQSGKNENTIRFGANDNHLYIYLNSTTYSTLEIFKTWLSSNNVKVLYQLANSIEEQITNEELINQLNAIQPILGDNIITVNSNNELLMSVDIEAYTNTQKGINQYLLDNI